VLCYRAEELASEFAVAKSVNKPLYQNTEGDTAQGPEGGGDGISNRAGVCLSESIDYMFRVLAS
jgi:hypothetical protein